MERYSTGSREILIFKSFPHHSTATYKEGPAHFLKASLFSWTSSTIALAFGFCASFWKSVSCSSSTIACRSKENLNLTLLLLATEWRSFSVSCCCAGKKSDASEVRCFPETSTDLCTCAQIPYICRVRRKLASIASLEYRQLFSQQCECTVWMFVICRNFLSSVIWFFSSNGNSKVAFSNCLGSSMSAHLCSLLSLPSPSRFCCTKFEACQQGKGYGFLCVFNVPILLSRNARSSTFFCHSKKCLCHPRVYHYSAGKLLHLCRMTNIRKHLEIV